MVARDQMMAVLLAACPTFEPTWNALVEEWKDEPGGLPEYVALGDLARHLHSLLERRETGPLRNAFQAIERLHIDGDAFVKEAATIGILESLQNTVSDPDAFRPYLGSESAKWWDKLNRFWDGDPTALRE